MPRKIVVEDSEHIKILQETRAEDEAQLQELIKSNPDLLPIEEFGMTGPLLVVGRETALPSGSVDLAAIARSGELLVVEFKTGPENSDFRRALAQLLDYGSHLWSLSYDTFEATVPARYFASEYCQDARLRGKRSLSDGAKAVWPDMEDDDLSEWRERIGRQLDSGHFHYVLVAQRFTATIQKTAEYLNAVMPGARTYAVEIVRFEGDGTEAFETRTVLKPSTSTDSDASTLDEDRFLDKILDAGYRDFLQELFETCRGLGYRFYWGASGVSIRMPTQDMPEPLSIAWIFLPDRVGWMGLTDVNLGCDSGSAETRPSASGALKQYFSSVAALKGAEPARARPLRESAWHLSPRDAISQRNQVKELLAQLINKVSGSTE